ncbi:MAG: ERAP1-like C-terminal domain-containing protein [Parvularculaceae bacterium]|nr:ERAP1-like C-terminal domain-containing protein [Parvularculaceae bacterium]
MLRLAMIGVVAIMAAACSGRDAGGRDGAGGDEAGRSAAGRSAAGRGEAAQDGAPLGRLSDAATPRAYRIDLNIDPSRETFDGHVSIDVDLAEPARRIWLHGKGLDVSEFYAETPDGARVDATYAEVDVTGVARLDFESALPKGRVTLNASYSAKFSSSPAGLYNAQQGDDHYAATQFESISARKAFPGFDEPRFKTPFDVTITTRAEDVAISAAPEMSAQETDGGVRHVFETTAPLPTYLLSFIVGPYDIVEWTPVPASAVRSTPLPLRGAAPKGKGGELEYALKNAVDMVEMFEDYFDKPYPFAKLDIIAPPGFFGGAMENAGAITYNEYILLLNENSSVAQRRLHEFVHAHEIAHQWFGDYVTPAWWDDIWLNESFASWMHYKIAAEHWPEGEFDRSTLIAGQGAMAADSLVKARRIREPVETNAAINDAFDGITYQKGGAVLAMFESYLGESAFRAGVRTHMERFPYGTATSDDFMRSLADGSGRPEVIPAFRSFIDQPGLPLLSVRLDCEGDPKLEISQKRYAPLGSEIDTDKTWKVPMCAATGDANGRKSVCGLVDRKTVVIPIGAAADGSVSCPAYVVPNGDGSGYFRFTLDEAGWAALARAAAGLTAAQGVSYADSLDAAFRADALSASAYLDGVAALSRHAAWDVVSAVMDDYETLIDIAPDDEARAPVKAYARKLFRPLYDDLGEGTDSRTVLLRSAITRFMAIVALDPDVRADLLGDARRYIGLDAAPDKNALAPDFVETGLSVGVQEDGAPFFDRLLELVAASDDANFRANGIGALARTEDPELAARLLEALSDEAYSKNEFDSGFYRLLARKKTQDLAWAWTQRNFDRLTARTDGFAASYAGVGASFCSAQKAGEYENFVRDHADALPGYERTLANTLESIGLCVALSEARGREFADAAAARL